MTTCVIEDCASEAGVPGTARGLCRSHYKRLQRYGSAMEPPRKVYQHEGNCRQPDCSRPIAAKGYCTKHYANLHRTGSPTGLPPKDVPVCSVEGCFGEGRTKGMCRPHYDSNRNMPLRQQAELRSQKIKESLWHVCGVCQTRFQAHRSGRIAKFCSLACRNKAQTKIRSIPCDQCGLIINRKPSSFGKRPDGRNFCNRECSSAWQVANRLAEQTSGRIRSLTPRMKALYGKTCVVCGEDRATEYAHKIPARDGGTTLPENIYVLCATHHTILDDSPTLLSPEETKRLMTVAEVWLLQRSDPTESMKWQQLWLFRKTC